MNWIEEKCKEEVLEHGDHERGGLRNKERLPGLKILPPCNLACLSHK